MFIHTLAAEPPREALRYVNIDRTESIDGTDHDGDRTDRTEYLPARGLKLQDRLRRSELELRGPRNDLGIGPGAAEGSFLRAFSH